MFLVDLIYTKYLISVGNKEAVKAGLYSVGIYALNFMVISSWIDDKEYMVSGLIGGFLGTWWSVRKS